MKTQITLAKQLNALKMAFPEGDGTIKRSRLVWNADIRPTPLSRSYKIRLTYKIKIKASRRVKNPEIRVITPSLKGLAGDREIPHLYSQKDETLCLYLPGNNEWSQSMFLSKTIIPWEYTWFLYFEHWLLTDEWKGGGVHPT